MFFMLLCFIPALKRLIPSIQSLDFSETVYEESVRVIVYWVAVALV